MATADSCEGALTMMGALQVGQYGQVDQDRHDRVHSGSGGVAVGFDAVRYEAWCWVLAWYRSGN